MALWYQNAYEIVFVAYVFILRKECAKIQINNENQNENEKNNFYFLTTPLV